MPDCENCGHRLPFEVTVVNDGGMPEPKQIEYCPTCGRAV